MDVKGRLIEKQAEEIKMLKEHIKVLEQKKQLLKEKIARLEKNSSNSSKPPSSDIVNPQPTNKRRKKRKIGGQKGHPKHVRPLLEADEINKTIYWRPR